MGSSWIMVAKLIDHPLSFQRLLGATIHDHKPGLPCISVACWLAMILPRSQAYHSVDGLECHSLLVAFPAIGNSWAWQQLSNGLAAKSKIRWSWWIATHGSNKPWTNLAQPHVVGARSEQTVRKAEITNKTLTIGRWGMNSPWFERLLSVWCFAGLLWNINGISQSPSITCFWQSSAG